MSTTTDTLERVPLEKEKPLITGNQTFASVTQKISEIAEAKTPKLWWVAISISSSLMLMMIALIGWLVWEGIGVWGLNVPVGWGWAIVNFVFLGWYRTCGNADFSHSFSFSSEMAYFH